ncbi:ABC transporter ATP-binding protein [Paenibacillus sp. MER 99-2]|uniref:ABC transporter ATP-binding protein n=1 Tax=Paenibacillus sp. MER 99-2 TaxID=2939572 RepID=UPI00203FF8B3|nr:ABC transporter ATP-binding protein [Paenibacillus sp. MER 99-2]MCM3172880.1 ABC transporter ATP-binding protein/permease [Paenibacillus sp. MER 99-2]
MITQKRTYTTRSMMIRLWKLTGRYRMFIILLLFAAFAASLIEVGYLESIRRLVKGATESQVSLIYSGLIIGALIVVLRILVTAFMTWIETLFQQKSLLSVQTLLLSSLGNTETRDLTPYHTGDLTARIWTSAKEAQKGINQHGIELAKNIIQLILAFAYFSWVNLPLSLAVIAFTLIYPLITVGLGRRLQRQHDLLNASAAARDEMLTEIIQAPVEIRSYGLAGSVQHDYKERMNRVFRQTMSVSVLQRLSEAAGRISTYGGMILILYLGGIQVLNGHMDVGGLAAFLVASSQLTRPIESLSGLWNDFISSASHASRIFEVLDLEKKNAGSDEPMASTPETNTYVHIESGSDQLAKQDKPHAIDMQHVSFRYGEQEEVLSDISFTAMKGKLTVITGPSGCGKTTLLKLLAGLYAPNEGAIQVTGSTQTDQVHQVYVPQQAFIFTGSVEENIAFGLEGISVDQVEAAAQMTHAHDAIMRQSLGYKTELQPQGGSMSGGELQRISLARAVLRNPDILLLDEPTSSQDPWHEQQLNRLMTRMTTEQDMTIIAVTHRLSLIERADQVIYIQKGRIQDVGTHHELLNRPNGYRSYITEQSAAGN